MFANNATNSDVGKRRNREIKAHGWSDDLVICFRASSVDKWQKNFHGPYCHYDSYDSRCSHESSVVHVIVKS